VFAFGLAFPVLAFAEVPPKVSHSGGRRRTILPRSCRSALSKILRQLGY
jgi:hypothetical protein